MECERKRFFNGIVDLHIENRLLGCMLIPFQLMQILQLGIKQQNNKAQQKLHGVTHFSRIRTPISSDPLNGIYQIPNCTT
jgi:hypothetical protein